MEDDPCQREIRRALERSFLVLEVDTPAKALGSVRTLPRRDRYLDLRFFATGNERRAAYSPRNEVAAGTEGIGNLRLQRTAPSRCRNTGRLFHLSETLSISPNSAEASKLVKLQRGTCRKVETIMKIHLPRLEANGSSEHYSIELKAKRQLAWINSELGSSSGTEHRALAKAREELLDLMRSLADSKGPDMLV
jgi:hypothetical protein